MRYKHGLCDRLSYFVWTSQGEKSLIKGHISAAGGLLSQEKKINCVTSAFQSFNVGTGGRVMFCPSFDCDPPKPEQFLPAIFGALKIRNNDT